MHGAGGWTAVCPPRVPVLGGHLPPESRLCHLPHLGTLACSGLVTWPGWMWFRPHSGGSSGCEPFAHRAHPQQRPWGHGLRCPRPPWQGWPRAGLCITEGPLALSFETPALSSCSLPFLLPPPPRSFGACCCAWSPRPQRLQGRPSSLHLGPGNRFRRRLVAAALLTVAISFAVIDTSSEWRGDRRQGRAVGRAARLEATAQQAAGSPVLTGRGSQAWGSWTQPRRLHRDSGSQELPDCDCAVLVPKLGKGPCCPHPPGTARCGC